jgi:cysteine desulfurase
MQERTYLDWNATAPLRVQAREAMLAALDFAGNPSSIHAEGRAARTVIEQARDEVANLLGAEPKNVTFTSGGTEANMLALSPSLERGGRKGSDRLLVSAIEHPSVRHGGRFSAQSVEEIPVDWRGQLDLAALAERLATLAKAGVRAPLVSLMLANNETGIVQPVAAAADLVHEQGGFLHVDAVQGAGKVSCNIKALKADLLTVSAHKLGGPKGVGALVRADESLHIPDSLIRGGGQERGLRGGTENVAGIAGFGAAAVAAAAGLDGETVRMRALRDRFELGLRQKAKDAVIFGADVERLPNTTLFAIPGVKAETAIIALDLEGIAVSSGAACSSGKVQASHVLSAMAVEPTLARGAIRVSVGYGTTESDIDRCLDAWIRVLGALLKGSRSMAA